MTQPSPQTPDRLPLLSPPLVLALAWLVPGLAHFVLGRKARGLAFFALLVGAFVFGCWLGGAFPWDFSGAPTRRLATLGVLGSGLVALVARHGMGYDPDPTGVGYEYGGAFILTAGLMNILLILDAWDITWGKEMAEPGEGENDGPDVEGKGSRSEPEEPAGQDEASPEGPAKKPTAKKTPGKKAPGKKAPGKKAAKRKGEGGR